MSKIYFSVFMSACVLVLIPFSARAGFEFVPPAVPQAIPSAAPVDNAPLSSDNVVPTPVVAALKDLPVTPSAPTDSANTADTIKIKTVAIVSQDRRHAIYPPPGNAAAAPLAGDVNVQPGLKIPVTVSPDAPPPIVKEDGVVTASDVMEPSEGPVALVDTAKAKSEEEKVVPVPDPASRVKIDGFGDSIPLVVALDQIIPKEYQVRYQDKPDAAMLVSWTGGRPWDDVLLDMLYAHDYRSVVRDKVVTIMKAPAPSVTEGTRAPSGFDANRQDIFSARTGESVRDVIGRWSDQAHVQLFWATDKNLILKDNASFNAPFVVAVTRLLDSFSNEPGHPVATMHPNLPDGPAVLSIGNPETRTIAVK